jgi:hypothetical protein
LAVVVLTVLLCTLMATRFAVERVAWALEHQVQSDFVQ